jgi:hypothetical protein
MPTLLVTKKMSPELAARVAASVAGRQAVPSAKLAPRIKSVLRFVTVALLLGAVVLLGARMQRARRDFDAKKAQLLDRLSAASEGVEPGAHTASSRATSWLPLVGGAYAGDFVAQELRPAGAFAAVLRRPALYVRGPLDTIATRTEEAAAASYRDAFVLCVYAPPPERTERLLRAKARAALSGRGDAMQPAAGVERLHDALVGLPFLAPEWRARVLAAESRGAVEKLERELARAPLARAKAAGRATLLWVVVDEPSTTPGPAELDGERPHDVRIGLVDLTAKKLLLRLRRRVDPAWLSTSSRAEYASGIDSCSLALDVHAAIAAER